MATKRKPSMTSEPMPAEHTKAMANVHWMVALSTDIRNWTLFDTESWTPGWR
jgi:hypothetical protein